MSDAAGAFAYKWIGENINADAYAPEGATAKAEALVSQMLVDAIDEGLSRGDLESAVGDLVSFIANAMENATDEEVRRLSEDDN